MPKNEREESRAKTDLLHVLLEMRAGRVAADLNEKFNQTLAAVLDTGGKGKMTIELFVAPSRMGTGGAVIEVELVHAVKLKTPEMDIGRSIFFVDRDGVLTREDPAQTSMFESNEEKEKARGKHN